MEAEELEVAERVQSGVTASQGKIGIILLAVLVTATVLPSLGSWLSPPTWEYRIESIEDIKWHDTMAKLGSQGWELASARRAISGEDDNRQGLYECIFKRRSTLFRTTPSKAIEEDPLKDMYRRSQEGR